jgi:hypothetical protein
MRPKLPRKFRKLTSVVKLKHRPRGTTRGSKRGAYRRKL